MRRVSAKKIPQTQRCPRDLFYSRQTAFKRQLNSCQTAAKQIGENPQKCTFRFSKLYFSFCRLYTETFDCYDRSSFMQSVIMKKNDKGQTVVQISYEKGKANGRKIVCGTEAEQNEYFKEYEAKNGGGSSSSSSTSSNPVDKATKKVKSGLKSGLNKLKKKK